MMTKRLSALFLALAAFSVISCTGGLQKGADYGKFDDGFDKVARETALVRSTDQVHSIVVLKGGKLIYEYHDPGHSMTQRHVLWSTSKSFTSLAVGFAIQDGLLSLDDKVVKFFPEAVPAEPDSLLNEVTVRDLAIMASGFGKDYIGQMRAGMEHIADSFFAQPFKFVPGSRYEYNSTNTYLMGVIVSKLTGKSLDVYLGEKLFKPLGIKDWYWEKSAEGYCFGGWGLYLSPESLAKAGQFLLQKGQWKGRQLLDAAYIEEATAKQIDQYIPGTLRPDIEKIAPTSDFYQGYGYQFWTCTHGAYRMSGAYGQWVFVIPDKDAVIVLTGYTASGGQQLMNLIWDNIYPAL